MDWIVRATVEKIAAEITTRRNKAKRLQNEAKEVFENSKTEVERMILGE